MSEINENEKIENNNNNNIDKDKDDKNFDILSDKESSKEENYNK